jgi:transcription factor S
MEFCPKCGCVLTKSGKTTKCARCNYRTKDKLKISTSEKIEQGKRIGVVKDKDTDVFPKVNAVCDKCGHREAYFWSAQTRSADEAETRFFKCTKCGNTWREYT